MKKILLIMALCVAFLCVGTSAMADVWCGTAKITGICMAKSGAGDVPPACCVNLTYSPEGNAAVFAISASALGTQLNLALLKAYNEQRAGYTPTLPDISIVLDATAGVLPFGTTYIFDITKVGFGDCDACCTC